MGSAYVLLVQVIQLVSQRGLSYLVFADNPGLPLLITKGHSTQDGHRDSQATLAKLSILDFGVVNGLLDGLGYSCHGCGYCCDWICSERL